MTHFSTWVLLTGQQALDVKSSLEKLLQRYSENLEVSKYYKSCYCLRNKLSGEMSDKYLIDLDCEECNGTGLVKRTRNPNSKWDYWCVGGRWSGALNDENVLPLSEIDFDKTRLPSAIVDPDGNWYEKGKIGWFAVVSDEKEDWNKQAMGILEGFDSCIVVVCDLHI